MILCRSGSVGQPVPEGVRRGRGTRREPELGEDVAEVALDRLLAQVGSPAIARFVPPAATSRSTSSSRADNPPARSGLRRTPRPPPRRARGGRRVRRTPPVPRRAPWPRMPRRRAPGRRGPRSPGIAPPRTGRPGPATCLQARRDVVSAPRASPSASSTADSACSAIACSMGIALDRLSAAISSAAARAAATSPTPSWISTTAASRPAALPRIEALDRAEDQRARERGVPLRQAEQRQAGLRLVSRCLRPARTTTPRRQPSPRSRWTSACWYQAPQSPWGSPRAARSRASSAAASASSHAPCSRNCAARCAWHCPVKPTMSGRSAHQWSRARVHSRARRASNARPARLQHPAVDDARRDRRDLAAVTATMASSSYARPASDRRA